MISEEEAFQKLLNDSLVLLELDCQDDNCLIEIQNNPTLNDSFQKIFPLYLDIGSYRFTNGNVIDIINAASYLGNDKIVEYGLSVLYNSYNNQEMVNSLNDDLKREYFKIKEILDTKKERIMDQARMNQARMNQERMMVEEF